MNYSYLFIKISEYFSDSCIHSLPFEHENLSDTDNELVFKAVHKYIKQTKRFSSGN